MNFKRILKLPVKETQAILLLGPRKCGKTTLLRQCFPHAKYYDLLKAGLRNQFTLDPDRFREEILAETPPLVIVDEIQKVPELLDQIHWCLENTKSRFILSGSSARKLKRHSDGLLGGRAWLFKLFPLTTFEVEHFDLQRALFQGLIPSHYLSKHVQKELESYRITYLEEEIRQEATTRNIQAFSRFLETAALMSGELINYSNIAREAGVSHNTIREYYQILEDTLLGFTLPAWKKKKDRRLIETAKFYLFDPGITRYLKQVRHLEPRTDVFGSLFEHFVIHEIRAFLHYNEIDLPITYWRTSTNLEVDLILGDMEYAIEVKSSETIQNKELRPLRALKEEFSVKKAAIICREEVCRKTPDEIYIFPWKEFCKILWEKEWIT